MTVFEQGYFVASEVSNYVDYREKKFEVLARDIVSLIGQTSTIKLFDFGAATGGLISALKNHPFELLVGTDISYWAVNFGRQNFNLSPNELQHYNRQLLQDNFDYVVSLDVLEHIPDQELDEILSLVAAKRLIIRVPVSSNEGEDFVLEVSKNDKTHIQIHDKLWWESKFAKFGFQTEHIIKEESIYDSEGVLARVFVR